MHAVGIDISAFNVMISNVKITKTNLILLQEVLLELTNELALFLQNRPNKAFEAELLSRLGEFNKENFPSPDFKRKVDR